MATRVPETDAEDASCSHPDIRKWKQLYRGVAVVQNPVTAERLSLCLRLPIFFCSVDQFCSTGRNERALFVAAHVQDYVPKLSRVSLGQARITVLQTPEGPPFSLAKHLLRVDSSQDLRSISATGR